MVWKIIWQLTWQALISGHAQTAVSCSQHGRRVFFCKYCWSHTVIRVLAEFYCTARPICPCVYDLVLSLIVLDRVWFCRLHPHRKCIHLLESSNRCLHVPDGTLPRHPPSWQPLPLNLTSHNRWLSAPLINLLSSTKWCVTGQPTSLSSNKPDLTALCLFNSLDTLWVQMMLSY